MANDSTTGGYLTPTSATPDYDQALERNISQWIQGVSGLTKAVFPRWTDPQPKLPDITANWASFGISVNPASGYPVITQSSDTESSATTFETFDVLISFYGPLGMQNAGLFRSGLFISQNNETLKLAGLTLVKVSDRVIVAPELINNRWQRRYDLTATVGRSATRTYAIDSIITPNVIITGA